MNNLKRLGPPTMRATAAVASAAAAVLQTAVALAAPLQLRDINGNPTTITADAEFAYDSVLNATWFLTANSTALNWSAANAWAVGLTVGTFSGWALPSADPVCGYGKNCTGSQMGSLYYTALGNAAGGPLSNTGPFKDLLSDYYWSGTEYAPRPSDAWVFDTRNGFQTTYSKGRPNYALAVRPGDVAAVPEPSNWALLLVVLGVLGARRRR